MMQCSWVAMLLLGCSEWLQGHCYAIAKIFRVVISVAIQLLEYSEWLPECCYALLHYFEWSIELLRSC